MMNSFNDEPLVDTVLVESEDSPEVDESDEIEMHRRLLFLSFRRRSSVRVFPLLRRRF